MLDKDLSSVEQAISQALETPEGRAKLAAAMPGPIFRPNYTYEDMRKGRKWKHTLENGRYVYRLIEGEKIIRTIKDEE